MKKLIVALVIICLGGCAGTPPKPPTGCENSFIWKCGFMPEGQDVVELGFAALLTAEPKIMPQVKAGAIKAYQLVQNGTLKGAVAALAEILNKNPRLAPLALAALQHLDIDMSLDSCDQAVLLEMFHNIALYAGATDQDFNTSLAKLDGRQE
jgi:hypothetical protein|uniref:Uncharacterized protein n=1 Tax=Desulfobacca acetoxidans TaxID=60893 RepID=A0A7V6A116_9BACT